MKRKILLFVLLGLLLLTTSVSAMSSTNYRLDWFTPLTTNGGGVSTSTHYSANITIGQVAPGSSVSSHYQAGIGFWYGFINQLRLFLPVLVRNLH